MDRRPACSALVLPLLATALPAKPPLRILVAQGQGQPQARGTPQILRMVHPMIGEILETVEANGKRARLTSRAIANRATVDLDSATNTPTGG